LKLFSLIRCLNPIGFSILLTVMSSCSTEETSSTHSKTFQTKVEEICCRDGGGFARCPTYRVRVPRHWVRHDPAPDESIADTRKNLCSFTIEDVDGSIQITIHNFPSESLDARIPPVAQLTRWQRQFSRPQSHQVTPQAFGGFAGLRLEMTGYMDNQPSEVMMLAWAMQMAHEHYNQLMWGKDQQDEHRLSQMRADYTIKAVGPIALMQRHKKALVRMARRFELIEEIPSRP
jgi:hypothetical protein